MGNKLYPRRICAWRRGQHNKEVSEQLEKKIKAYGFNIPLHMIDREFIATVGHLCRLELFSKTYSENLRSKFYYIYYGVEAISDL
jgi:hypothetical protein